ncbi:MAG: N-6 DNA methylase [Anaeromicrobium sp.]|uniref:N-6 DNA methylase n=1 Tax=Anaeromicrobium sp. TaxID=1929132 RepID=UPI0025E81D4F|nr:N-6 DNA methylase [Anaeromicrobium sp.]MCT4593934.1 N-6 DNA methylase [Anaeromicrobium sp.]
MASNIQYLNQIKDCLNEVGYNNEKIIDNYPVTVQDKVIYFDFVAFGHDKVQDTSTSCIAVKFCSNEQEENQAVDDTKYSAAPILIVPKKSGVNIWKIDVEKKSDNIWELQYDELGEYFAQNRVKFNSDKIVSSKQDYEQMTFFNAGNLFKFASKINCKLLGEEFKNAIYNARKKINIDNEEQVMDLTSITMHIIAAKILNDKLLLGKRYDDIHEIINRLSNQYSDYFNKENLYKYGIELIDIIYNSFKQSVSYRSIDNRILGSFYENTLFESNEAKNKKMKRELGIYYTPTSIVNNMLKTMPIEFINYKERFVLDGSCGSGSMLIGTYKRLIELLPKKMKDELKHKYLTDMILGIDIDRFACEVARLEMLLISIPYGNGWKIKNSDFTVINNMKVTPNIIIANPPYQEKRSGKQLEKATGFLDKYIDLLSDDGIIGIVMPEGFLENNSGRDTRLKLLTNIDIYEIWSLPKGIFDTNNCATVVIIGRKVKKGSLIDTPIKIRIVNKNLSSITKFKSQGIFDFDFVYSSQKDLISNKNYKIIFSPVDTIIRKIESNKKICDFVDYTQGIQIPFKYDYPLVSDGYKEGYSKFLRNARLGFDKYKIEWLKQEQSKYLKYDPHNIINREFKGLRLRERKRNLLEGVKVIFHMNSTPGTFWRTKAAIDREGIYPSHSFWCFVPKDNRISLEIIVALMNSKIINLYLGNKNRALNIKSDNFLNVPVPNLAETQRCEIEQLVRKIEKEQDNESSLRRIDELFYSAFNLTDSDIELVNDYYSKFTGENNVRDVYIREDTMDTMEVTGKTIDVDLVNNYIKVKFVECEEYKYIKIDNEIPGWLLNKDIKFVGKLKEDDFYEENVCLKNVKPLDFTYLNNSEFDDLLYSNFNDYNMTNYSNCVSLEGGA